MEQNSLGHSITDRSGTRNGKHAPNCCVYFWIGLFVFSLPSGDKDWRSRKKTGWWESRTESHKKKRTQGFVVIRKKTSSPSEPYFGHFLKSSFFFFGVQDCFLPCLLQYSGAISPMLLIWSLTNGTEDRNKDFSAIWCHSLDLLCYSSYEVEKGRPFFYCSFKPQNLWNGHLPFHRAVLRSLIRCWVFASVPLHPPGLQMSRLARAHRCFDSKACHLRKALMAGSCEAAGLSKRTEQGIMGRQPYRKGLHNESVSENLRLASVIDERFIGACWSDTSVTWRRPGELAYFGFEGALTHRYALYMFVP